MEAALRSEEKAARLYANETERAGLAAAPSLLKQASFLFVFRGCFLKPGLCTVKIKTIKYEENKNRK
jgi:hypothetical protein